MIDKLTKEQIEQLEVYKNKWLEIGLSTRRANRSVAENAAKEAYKIAGLKEPKHFIWVDSPMSGLIAAKLIKEISKKYNTYISDQVWAQVRAQIGDQVWDQIGAQIGAQVRAQIGDQVWDQVWDQVGDQVGDQVRAQVWDQVGDQVGDQVRAQVRDQVWDQVGDQGLKDEWNDVYFWGSQEAGWLSFYSFFLEVTKLKCCEKLIPLIILAQEVGWTWFYTDVVIFTERPIEIHRNEQNRLHHFNQMAIKYADGYGLYVVNGIRVPEYICTTNKNSFTKDQFLKEQNADYRRCIVQKIGIEKTIEFLGAEVIDTYESKVGGMYELLHIDYDGRGKRPYLKMFNKSINNWHIEGIKPGIKTVKEAICYRNGLTEFQEPEALS